MSLLNFTPLDVHGRPYAIQEFNGKIATGSFDEFKAVTTSEILSSYPNLEKSKLNSLQHSISKNDMRDVFATRNTSGLQKAWDKWSREGLSGVVDHVATATESGRLWPIAKIGKSILKVQNGVSSLASKVLPTVSQEKIDDLLQMYGHTINWKDNWLRCIAIHENGRRIAICQQNNYIRVYNMSANQSSPFTLYHPSQKNVACMAWQLFDHRVLAVGAESSIIIWRFMNKTFNLKPSAQYAQVIDLSIGPISQIIWDKTTSGSLFVVSPNNSKIMMVDTANGEVDSLGAWTGGSITKVIPTSDGKRLAVLYTGNLLRVYNKATWSSEKWGSLDGRATDAIWSPNGECLVFTTQNSHQLYAINFNRKDTVNSDGQKETSFIGESVAVSVYDLSAVEFDPSELEDPGSFERPIQVIGGEIHALCLSPDGQRLAIQFKHNPEVIALFIVDWNHVVRFIPIGLVEAPACGVVTIVQFMPHFSYGSLLTIVWSSGYLQYLPLIYGENSTVTITANTFSSRTYSPNIDRLTSRRQSIGDSLCSVDLPPNLRASSPGVGSINS